MGLVRGEDVILSAEQAGPIGTELVPFGCARSVTFDISTDFIETSVTESGAFKTFLPSGKQYSGNIEGLVFLNKPGGSNVRAFLTVDYSSIPALSFPNTENAAEINVLLPFTTLNICSFNFTFFFSLGDYINAIIAAINAPNIGIKSKIATIKPRAIAYGFLKIAKNITATIPAIILVKRFPPI